MKKIDNWLSIQRYVSEVSHTTPIAPLSLSNVEVWGRVRNSKRSTRVVRRFLTPRISTI